MRDVIPLCSNLLNRNPIAAAGGAPLQPLQHYICYASAICTGSRQGAPTMTSKRALRPASAGRAARNSSAVVAIRRRCSGLSDSSASASVRRSLTSTKTIVSPRRAMMSISPVGARKFLARMPSARSLRCSEQTNSASRPARSDRHYLPPVWDLTSIFFPKVKARR